MYDLDFLGKDEKFFISHNWLVKNKVPEIYLKIFDKFYLNQSVDVFELMTTCQELQDINFVKWLYSKIPYDSQPILYLDKLDSSLFYLGDVIVEGDATISDFVAIKGNLRVKKTLTVNKKGGILLKKYSRIITNNLLMTNHSFINASMIFADDVVMKDFAHVQGSIEAENIFTSGKIRIDDSVRAKNLLMYSGTIHGSVSVTNFEFGYGQVTGVVSTNNLKYLEISTHY